jgi:uncharacterized BrkB/YihY/UPF0761 family membrane protein
MFKLLFNLLFFFLIITTRVSAQSAVLGSEIQNTAFKANESAQQFSNLPLILGCFLSILILITLLVLLMNRRKENKVSTDEQNK